MNRRKVLLGLGSLATLAGGAIGTGAFSEVTAPRDAQISVASDSEAFLRIDATNSASDLVGQQDANGTIAFDFAGGTVNSSASAPEGSGLNPESVTTVPNAFEVYNYGTETIQVKADIPSDGFGADVTSGDELAVKQAITFTYTDTNDNTYDLLWDESQNATEWVEFPVGEGGWVEIEFDLRETGLTGDLVNEITFTAQTNTTSQ
ncbi:hypothetical protein [Halolamina litorea]|uniref:Uncharacterized protein n=1 Tax=Halolamina litorea TaxID=1515593 RepID=A0ABD6BUZ6_9EURY|nr:hypothetical protein [Halolamina litorea]